MAGHRNAFRVGVGLDGWVAAVGGDGRRQAARAVDLSRTGIGLIGPGRPEVGAEVRVGVEDADNGHPVGRQWSGRVAYAREVAGGLVRVGVAFEWPVGPGARTEAAVREGRSARAGQSSVSAKATPGRGAWVVPALVASGFAADQASKAWAASAGAGVDGWVDLIPGLLAAAPLSNFGAFGSLAGGSPVTAPACAAGGLVLAGLALSGARRPGGVVGSAGLGLLGAGLLGNSADRLALGHVRDFLVSDLFPQWSFNLADVFLVAGALVLLAANGRGACSRKPTAPDPGTLEPPDAPRNAGLTLG